MKNIFVNQLADGASFENQTFALQEFSQHKDKNGNTYFRVVLQDRTGDIVGKVWNDKLPYCKISQDTIGEVLEVTASISSYRNNLQATIESCKLAGEYNLEDLVQVSDKGIDNLWSRTEEHIKSVKDKDLQNLLGNLFSDEEILRKYKEAPAAERVHHDFVGGLMEHTLELLDLSDPVVAIYPRANIDIIKTGILIHDIGKIDEIVRSGTTFVKSVEGKIVGHMGQGIEIVKDHLPEDFPVELWNLLLHIILSHHGTHEYGSPVVPKTIEAIIVHQLDYLSSHVRMFAKELEMAEEGRDFSDYNRYIGAEVYLTPYSSDPTTEKVQTEEETGGATPISPVVNDPDQVALF